MTAWSWLLLAGCVSLVASIGVGALFGAVDVEPPPAPDDDTGEENAA